MESFVPRIMLASLVVALTAPGCKTSKQSPPKAESTQGRAEPSPEQQPTEPTKRKRRADMVGPTTVVANWPMWKKFDSDGDGALSDVEQTTMKTDHVNGLFKRYDSNADGLLSKTEASTVEGRIARQLSDFKKVDSDGSGSIDSSELFAIIRY